LLQCNVVSEEAYAQQVGLHRKVPLEERLADPNRRAVSKGFGF
jgi:hypothetical protein